MYAVGHGASITPSSCYVFLSDANTIGDKYGSSINIAVIQEAMAQCAAKTNIYIMDASATGEERSVNVPPGKGIGLDIDEDGVQLRMRNCTIRSAIFGQQAWTTPDGRSTVFSSALLRMLGRCGQWSSTSEYFAVTADRLDEDFPLELEAIVGKKLARRQRPNVDGRHEAGGIHKPDPAPEFNVQFSLPEDHVSSASLSICRDGSAEILYRVELPSAQIYRFPPGQYYYFDSSTPAGMVRTPKSMTVDRDGVQEVRLPRAQWR